MENTRRVLQRNTRDGRIGGVAAGLADYFGIDPTIVRLAFVLLVVAGGFGIVAYLVAWLVMPADDGSTASGRTRWEGDNRWLLGLGLLVLVLGVIGLAATRDFRWIDELVLWPFVLIAAGLGLLLWRRDDQRPTDPPPVPPVDDSIAHTAEYPVGEATEPTRVLAAPSLPPVPQRRGPSLPIGWITLAAIAVSAAIAGLLDTTGALDVSARWFLVYAVALAAVAIAAGAFFGRVIGPLVLTIMLSAALAVAWAVDVPVRWSAGDRTVSPATAAELDSEYRLGAGELVLDLRQLDLDGATRRVEASVSVGKLLVLVPPGAETAIDGHASVGEVELFNELEDGVGVSSSAGDEDAVTPGDRLLLDLDVGIGKVEVR